MDDSELNDEEDHPPHGGSSLQPPPPPSIDNSNTTPKTITPTNHAHGGARKKTGFPSGANQTTVVISG